jgi:hypothetical protein
LRDTRDRFLLAAVRVARVALVACFWPSCTDYDAYEFTTLTRCGEHFVDVAAGECLPGPPLCGCDAEQNCGYAGDGKFACITSGSGALNSPCTSNGECQQGMGCAGGLCRRFCASVDDCTDAASAQCSPLTDGDAQLPVRACFYDCDPVSPDLPIDPQAFVTCGSSATCTISDTRHSGCLAGRGSGTGSCTDTRDCAPGWDCFDQTCSRYCWTAADDCPAGQACAALASDYGDTAILLGVLELGVCQ